MSYGPGTRKSPEEIAEDIMNQSGEGLDDIMEGTEIYDDFGTAEPLGVDELIDTGDDGGDYSE
jgi:hypothetical protein